jgi:hypothetical protein
MKLWENINDPILENEIWKIINDFPDYRVSNFGRIKSFKFGKERILKQNTNSDGYFQISLLKNGKQKNKKVHHLVFETHNNYKLKDGECVHHTDEDKENNYFDNLKLMTKSDHKKIHMAEKNNPNFGKHLSHETKNKISINQPNRNGENHPRHKLTEEQVIQIKLLLEEGILNNREIGELFGVCYKTISNIKTGRTWNHINTGIKRCTKK